MSDFLLPSTSRKKSVTLRLLDKKTFASHLKKQPAMVKNWVKEQGFNARTENSWISVPDSKGNTKEIWAVAGSGPVIWSLAHLPPALPQATYKLECTLTKEPAPEQLTRMAIGWGLACYTFTRFRSEPAEDTFSALIVPRAVDISEVQAFVESATLVRDLINSPANAMGPSELAEEARKLAKEHGAKCSVIVGKDLLKKNYPAIYEVGQACDDPPRLIDLTWGKAKDPKITLVGKGVCFDTGGLDLKSPGNMKLMKKDMGGAAAVMGLASMIMRTKLPVRLRVLIPAVENSVAGNAFRPQDVIQTRKGLTVEIGNTDAEGRLVLCDALYEADEEKPALIIDCATLTGAARVALGADMPAFFTDSHKLSRNLEEAAQAWEDPLWRLPLFMPYDDHLKSAVADLNNISSSGYGGAITAALYLKRFVSHTKEWVHVDMMAWNLSSRPGRPAGGEAMGLRALYALVKKYT